jgi:ArpU family phage transcriptional regulator
MMTLDRRKLLFLKTNITKEAKREAEKMMGQYKSLPAIIEANKIRAEQKVTPSYGSSESQRDNQFYSTVENMAELNDKINEYEKTFRILTLVYDSLKPAQQLIWDRRYVLGQYDTNIYIDLGLPHRTYYRLKREMVAVVADAFNLINGTKSH